MTMKYMHTMPKTGIASNAWVNTVNKRTLTLGPHWDQLQGALTTIIKQFTDQKVKKNVSLQKPLHMRLFLLELT